MIQTRLVPFLVCALAHIVAVSAFVPSSHAIQQTHRLQTARARIGGPLFQSSEEGGGGGLFGGLFGGGKKADPNEPKKLFEIPLSAIKIGGLRIALSLHCIGQQNTPDKGTWLANQADDGVIEMWYNPDQSGMFSITLSEGKDNASILVERHGPKPSLVYQLQESLQLHKVLDELEILAFGNSEEIEEENRLLKLEEKDAIDKARETLPARKE